MKFTPRLPEKNVNVTPTSPLRDFFVLLTGLLAIVVGVYVLLGFAVDLIVPRISPATEQKLAGYFSNMWKSSASDSEKSQSVQKLLNTMQEGCIEMPYSLVVHVSENPLLNAVALPGGNIVIFSGLLEKLESENELSFVLAHETGHFVNRDHLRGLGRLMIFMTISAVVFGTDSSVGNFLAQWLNITEMSFSRSQESKADKYALDVLNCVFGHVGGATDFFEKISKEERTGFMSHYLSTHPESRKRISSLKEYGRLKGFSQGPVHDLPAGLKNDSEAEAKGQSTEDRAQKATD